MVSFKRDRFIIEIHTDGNTVEAWMETHKELLLLLQSVNPDFIDALSYRRILILIEEMMPHVNMAEKMMNE